VKILSRGNPLFFCCKEYQKTEIFSTKGVDLVRNQRLLTIKEAREILRVGHVKIYEMAQRKEFPVIRVGKNYRVPEKEFFEWLSKKVEYNGKQEV